MKFMKIKCLHVKYRYIDFLYFLQGFVCHRVDQLGTGCCNKESETTQKYACDTCNKHGCCAIYEYCVSCCLHPDKVLNYHICLQYFSLIR